MSSSMDIESRVRSVLGAVLGKELGPNDTVSKDKEPLWDSMKHIEIIITMEQEFDVSFEPEEIPSLLSLSAITQRIKALLNG